MKRMQGFTLVELVVVLVLATILAITVIPRDPGRTLNLPAQAEQLAADLRYVQALSMTQGNGASGQRYCLFLTSTSYQIRHSDCSASNAVLHPASGSTDAVTLNNVTLSWTNLTNSYVSFTGKGEPYVSAATALAANAVITLSADGVTKTVTISPETGYVAVGS
jgi:prepilin-type N-terminal cleavage/methylation domain-containing protein